MMIVHQQSRSTWMHRRLCSCVNPFRGRGVVNNPTMHNKNSVCKCDGQQKKNIINLVLSITS